MKNIRPLQALMLMTALVFSEPLFAVGATQSGNPVGGVAGGVQTPSPAPVVQKSGTIAPKVTAPKTTKKTQPKTGSNLKQTVTTPAVSAGKQVQAVQPKVESDKAAVQTKAGIDTPPDISSMGKSFQRDSWVPLRDLPAPSAGIKGTCSPANVPNEELSKVIVDVGIGGLNAETCFEYDNNRNVSKVVDPLGYVSTSTWDGRSRPIASEAPTGASSTYSYTPNSNLERETGERIDLFAEGGQASNTVNYGYDVLGNPITSEVVNGPRTWINRDLDNRVVAEMGPGNRGYVTTYNSTDQVLTRDFCRINGESGGCDQLIIEGPRFEYDSKGRLHQLIKPEGGTITYEYDNWSRVSRLALSSGESINYRYDERGFVASIEWKNSANEIIKLNEFLYDQKGRVTISTETYYKIGHFRQGIRAEEVDYLQMEYRYDDRNNDVTVTTTDGGGGRATTVFDYDKLGRLVVVRGSGMNDVRYSYDKLGRVTVVESGGRRVTNEYGVAGLEKTTDELGRVIEYRWNSDGNIRKVKSGGVISETTYDNLGRPVAVGIAGTDRMRVSFAMRYDNAGRLTSIENGLMPADILSGTLYYPDDSIYAGLPMRKVMVEGAFEEYEAYEVGKPLRWTDGEGNKFSTQYDDFGRLMMLQAEGGGKRYGLQFAYTPFGYLAAIDRMEDGRIVSSYEAVRDSSGRILEEHQTINGMRYDVKTIYGDFGVAVIEMPSGARSSYEYGVGGRLERINGIFEGGANLWVRRAYDVSIPEQVAGLQFGNGMSMSYDYGRGGQLLGMHLMRPARGADGGQIMEDQPTDKNKAGAKVSFGSAWQAVFTGVKKQEPAVEKQGQEDDNVLDLEEVYGETYRYDMTGRQSAVQKRYGLNPASPLRMTTIGYNYDTAGNLTGQFELARLIENNLVDPGPAIASVRVNSDEWERRWSYNVVDGMLDDMSPQSLKEYNVSGSGRIREYSEVSGCTVTPDRNVTCPRGTQSKRVTFGYDRNGNLKNRDGGNETYEYNPFGQLVKYRNNTKLLEVLYGYDGLGRKISRLETVSGVNTSLIHYIYSGLNVVETRELIRTASAPRAQAGIAPDGRREVASQAGVAASAIVGSDSERKTEERIINYIYGNGVDDIVGMYEASKGSIYAVRGLDGVVIWMNSQPVQYNIYKTWGQYTAYKKDGTEIARSDEVSPVSYSAREYDAVSGLYYNRLRWYDPATHQFITQDPVLSGVNQYAYAGNNPITFNDPLGMSPNPNCVGDGCGPSISSRGSNVYEEALRHFGRGYVGSFRKGLPDDLSFGGLGNYIWEAGGRGGPLGRIAYHQFLAAEEAAEIVAANYIGWKYTEATVNTAVEVGIIMVGLPAASRKLAVGGVESSVAEAMNELPNVFARAVSEGRELIVTTEQLGRGSGATIYKGFLEGKPVAVKINTAHYATNPDLAAFDARLIQQAESARIAAEEGLGNVVYHGVFDVNGRKALATNIVDDAFGTLVDGEPEVARELLLEVRPQLESMVRQLYNTRGLIFQDTQYSINATRQVELMDVSVTHPYRIDKATQESLEALTYMVPKYFQ